MSFRIEEKSGFDVIGVKSREMKPFDEEISRMWANVMKNGDFHRILELANTELQGIHGFCDPTENGFVYYIASASTKDVPDGMYKLHVPNATWAIFKGRGILPEAIQKTWSESFQVLANSEYRQVQAPCIEMYLEFEEDMTSVFEIWVPVEKQ